MTPRKPIIEHNVLRVAQLAPCQPSHAGKQRTRARAGTDREIQLDAQVDAASWPVGSRDEVRWTIVAVVASATKRGLLAITCHRLGLACA